MNEMKKEQLRQKLSSPLFSYFVLFFVLLLFHLQLTLSTGDDVANSTILQEYNLFVRLQESYETWSSRQLIDALMYIICGLPQMVWRVLNPLVITIGVWCSIRLLQLERDARAVRFICLLVLCYEWSVLVSAGWITTTLSYVWPLVAALVAMQPYADMIRGKKTPLWAMLLTLPLLLYAGNMEQVLVVVTICLVCAVVSLMVQKKERPWLLLAQMHICFANFLYIATCPGAQVRVASESSVWFKDFGMRSIWQKIELGLANGFSHLMYQGHYLFFLLCFMLLLCIWKNYANVIYRALACFPFAVVLVLGVFGDFLQKYIPQLTFFENALTTTGMITVQTAGTPKRYLSFLLLCFVFSAVLVCLYLALGHTRDALVGIILLCAGFASYATMGFTPSIWASGTRTAFFVSLSVLGCCMMLYRMHFTAGKSVRAWRTVQVVALVCAVVQSMSLIGA